MEWFKGLTPEIQAVLATLFTWGVTAIGAGLVFFFRSVNKKVLDIMMGFAAGVMIAASFWSLLSPAIKMSSELGMVEWVPPVIGFLIGGLFLLSIDKIMPHLHVGFKTEDAEGVKTSWKRSVLLVLAITLHNIPEGLAIGVAFGSVAYGLESSSIAGAIALAIGIGLQNFPEGAAVSLPLRREGYSRSKSFLYGQASGVVEPISALLGVIAVGAMRSLLPYALSFAAGAMIFVVVEELIPESQLSGNTDLATIGTLLGFVVMMLLDVALG